MSTLNREQVEFLQQNDNSSAGLVLGASGGPVAPRPPGHEAEAKFQKKTQHKSIPHLPDLQHAEAAVLNNLN